MDNEFHIDLDEVLRNIDSAEVMAIYFPMLRRTLLVDTRANETAGPMVRVVPMVNAIEERFRGLRRMRPGFPRPESITMVAWPRPVHSLKRTGALDRLLARFADSGHAAAIHDARHAYEELVALESQETVNAITGEGYQSLWERSGRGNRS